MSAPSSHISYEIKPYPERAVTPEILYLHVNAPNDVGGEIPAAAVITPGGWKIVTFATDDDVTDVSGTLLDDTAVRAALEAIGRAAAA